MMRFVNTAVLLLIVFGGFSQNHLFYPKHTIYIDASNKDDKEEDGTARHPYDSWQDIGPLQSETRYYFRKGTSYQIESITIDQDKIEFGSYGTGDAPVFKSTAKQNKAAFEINDHKNIYISNIKIEAHNALACIQVKGYGTKDIQISSCELTGAEFGMRVIGEVEGLLINDCTIHDIGLDGIYAMYIRDVEIAYCNIYNVNLFWEKSKSEKKSTGDCIQLHSENELEFNVHHNTLDRSNNGNKFCFIVYGKNYKGELSYNTMIGNKEQNAGCVYLHPTDETVDVKYNWFESGSYGIYSYVKQLNVYYNLFIGQEIALATRENSTTESFNNLFYKPDVFYEIAGSGKLNSYNNIFSVEEASKKPFDINGSLTSDYNVYSSKLKTIKKEAHSIISDPGLNDPGRNNFKLKATSVCIDKGKRHEIESDMVGVRVPYGIGTDIGPLEFNK